MDMPNKYDVVIIGAGPAGLTAGIYIGRQRFKAVIFEKALAGGQMVISDWIENYPGFEKGVSGSDLAQHMRRQALNCGADIIGDEVTQINKPAGRQAGGPAVFLLKTDEGKEYQATALIIASGSQPKRLGIPGEDKFHGRGVSYCAVCDAPLFKDKAVAVIGGGDTAAQEALYLSKYCKKIYLIHRRGRLRAVNVLAERIAASKVIEPVWNSVVTEIIGDKKVTAVIVKNVGAAFTAARGQDGRGQALPLQCDGVFIFAGIAPNSDFAKGLVKIDRDGYIAADEQMKTSCEGIFACGDVKKKHLRQIVTACADAAVAAVSAGHYIEQRKGKAYADFWRHSK